MAENSGEINRASVADIVVEALRGIKNEILLYAVAVAALFISASAFGLDILREVKWPLLFIFTLALLAYFLMRGVPGARARLREKKKIR